MTDFKLAVDQLALTLERVLPQLQGDWVSSASNYETHVAALLDADVDRSRHCDCVVRSSGLRVELKKSSTASLWFNLVRYSEAVLEPELAHEVITIVLRYRRTLPQITHVAMIRHDALIDVFRLDDATAGAIIGLAERLPHQLNAQASLTWRTIEQIAFKVIRPQQAPAFEGDIVEHPLEDRIVDASGSLERLAAIRSEILIADISEHEREALLGLIARHTV